MNALQYSASPVSLPPDDLNESHQVCSNLSDYHMTHAAQNALEVIVATIATSVTAASSALLALVPDPTDELKLLLLPLIGGLLASIPTMVLYPERETRPVMMARAALAVLLACLLPQTLAIIFTSTNSFFSHPIIGLGAGILGFIVIYFLIKPLFEGLYRRRKVIAEAVLEQGQQRLMGNVREAVRSEVNGPVAIAATQAAKDVIATAEKTAQELKKSTEEIKQTAEEVKAAAEKAQKL